MSSLKPQPTLTVFRGWATPTLYVWSPFVMKLETRLRFAGVKYATEAGSMSKAPRGKIPYIAIAKTVEATPTMLGDSSLIIEALKDEGLLKDLNEELAPELKAVDAAFRALLEEKLYFYQNHERWVENYYTMRSHILGFMPYPMQVLIGLLAYRKMSATLYGQGTMRFSREEISAFRKQIWENVNAVLEASRRKNKDDEQMFWLLGGQNPTEADICLYGFVSSALACTAAPETMKVVQGYPTLIEWAKRIHYKYFPDYEGLAFE